MKDLKTVIEAPSREDAQRMVKIAYYIDKRFLRPIDMVDFGIDVYRLKECGEVRMSKSATKLRPHVAALWGRLTDPMKAMFIWSHLCQGVDEIRGILSEMKQFTKNTHPDENYLDLFLGSIAMKLPAELQAKIKEGFGKEWRR